MEKNTGSTQKLFGYFVTAFASCKTILRWHRRAPVLALSVTFALSACNQKTENHTHNPPPDYTGSNMGGGNGGGSVTGTGDGGGGQGIACTDKVKDPRFRGKVMVRDIYEAIRNHNRTMKTIPNDVSGTDTVSPEAIKVLVDSLKHFYGPASANLEFVNEKFWFDFVKKISFLDDDYKLHPSQDANSAIALPNECKIVQIAFWEEPSGVETDGTLYVKKDVWKSLDQTSKIGLLAHELFFKQARKAGHKNSDFVRLQIGKLISSEGLSPIFESWDPSTDTSIDSSIRSSLPNSSEGFKYCKGSVAREPEANVDFYQYRGRDGFQHFTILNFESAELSSSNFSYVHYKFDPNVEIDLAAALDIIASASDEKFSYLETLTLADNFYHKAYFEGRLLHLYKSPAEFVPAFEISQSLSELSDVGRSEIWVNSMSGAYGAIRVGISNPGYSSSQHRAMPAKEELVRGIMSLIRKHISSCGSDLQISDKGLVGILYSELTDMIRNGVRPEQFPKWSQALIEYFSILNDEDKCKISEEGYLNKIFPQMLYNVMLGNYDEDVLAEFEHFIPLADKPFTGFLNVKSSEKLKIGTLNLSRGDKQISLDLKCKSFDDMYWEKTVPNVSLALTSENKQLPKDLEFFFSKNEAITSSFVNQKFEVKIDQYGNMDLPENIENILINDFSDRIRSDSKIFNHEELKYDIPLRARIKELASEIFYSSKLGISSCLKSNEFRGNTEDGKAFFKGCVVISPATSKNSYKVFYSYNWNSESYKKGDVIYTDFDLQRVEPRIVFLKRVPRAK